MASLNDDSEIIKRTPVMCNICNANPSKYCCPRCSVLYCSLECYRSEKHSICSEEFYRECVTSEMVGLQAEPESRKRMGAFLNKCEKDFDRLQPALKKMINGEDINENEEDEIFALDPDDEENQEVSDSDDDQSSDLQMRLENINLDDADKLWKALTNDERNGFEALISKADFDFIIPTWDAWWSYSKEKSKIEEVGTEKDEKKSEHIQRCPKLIDVPKFSSITNVQPSDAIRFNIINVISSYAYIMRYFNGEIEPTEAAVYILSVCDNLNSNKNFEDLHTASASIELNSYQSPLIQSDKDSLDVMRADALAILQGPSFENHAFYCKAALSHLHTIFSEAMAAEKQNKKNIKNCDKSEKNGDKTPETGDNSPRNPDSTEQSSKTGKKSKEDKEFSQMFPEHGKEHLPKLDISKVKRCIKKIEYYLSFIESHNSSPNKDEN